MKPEFDRETDALLRNHARRGGARAGDGASAFARDGLSSDRGVAFAEHLDADELNAFAENAAPEAARTRYLSHIADCADCRRAATGLALAANAALARDEPRVSEEKIVVAASWRAWLAALFAPGAWRYAMPVVALLGVGVVALVLMKRVPLNNRGAAPQSESQLANANATEQEQKAAVVNQQQQPSQTSTQPQPYSDAPTATTNEDARRDADAVANPVDAKSGGVIAPASPGAAKSGEEVGAAAGASKSQVAQRRVEELQPPPAEAAAPVLAATPSPPQPKPDEVASATAKDSATAKNVAKSVKDEESAERAESLKKTRRAEANRNEPSENAPPAPRASSRAALNSDDTSSADRSGGARNRQLESRARGDSRAREDKEKRGSEADDNSSPETRKVVGRKFRRQGDAWIDTAYNSSQATTVVRRNSEQYRALVADEPEIGRIASALGGEIVVVWKGRAYRIKP